MVMINFGNHTPYCFIILNNMSNRPRALRGMLVGKTKNNEIAIRVLTLSNYYSDKEKNAIVATWIQDGKVLRLI
jgi:hypothetical protein